MADERWEMRGKRRLKFDNGRSEDVFAVAVPHEPSAGMWARIWIARDRGELAARIVRVPELEAAEQQRDRLLEAVRIARFLEIGMGTPHQARPSTKALYKLAQEIEATKGGSDETA